jgi:hypothetical protein
VHNFHQYFATVWTISVGGPLEKGVSAASVFSLVSIHPTGLAQKTKQQNADTGTIKIPILLDSHKQTKYLLHFAFLVL